MTSNIKTFSRARAAKAALVKLLIENHEVPEAHVQITTFEPTAGRHTARADFLVAQPELVLQDLAEQGWTYTAPEKAVAIIDLGEAGDATPYPAPAPVTAADAPKSNYVAETSTVTGATKRVWAIADSMPGAKRKDVIEACRVAGVAFGTARTQYQKWFTAKKNG